MNSGVAGLLTAALCAAVAGGACRQQPQASSRCADLYKAEDFAMALTECEREFISWRRAEAGITAARAALRLGRADDVVAWRDRLSGTPEEGTATLLVAVIREQQRDNEQAKQAYLKALALQRASGDARKTADVLYRLFYFSWRTAAYRDAFTYATEAFAEAAKVDDRALQQASLEGLFAALYEIGDLDGAEQILAQTESVIAPGDRPARARLLLHRGAVYLGQLRPALARVALEDALQFASEGDTVFLIRARFNLIEAALLDRNVGEAERQLKIARQLAATTAADNNRRAALGFYQSWVDYEQRRFRAGA